MLACLAAGTAAGLVLGAWRRSRAASARQTPFSPESIADAFGSAIILLDQGDSRLVAGGDRLAECAALLGADEPGQDGRGAARVLAALCAAAPEAAKTLAALRSGGVACDVSVAGPRGAVRVQGRAGGALAWLRLTPGASGLAVRESETGRAPWSEALLALPTPAWIAGPDESPTWVNGAWLEAAGAASLAEALAAGTRLDRALESVARDAARGQAAAPRQAVVWTTLPAGRRALAVTATPLRGGVAVSTVDVTALAGAGETLRRQARAHEAVLAQVGEAIAVFGPDARLVFHNQAFASLWELEPAWLAERPGHGEILDRLRQQGRLPETLDYPVFKAAELGRHKALTAPPETLWRLPGERTLRVSGVANPAGGLTLIFGDVTPELRLKTQFNQLIGVQRATLDKLTDAVAVFGADARLKLHNEAFARFWGLTAEALAGAPDFDAVADLCVPRLHDRQFWRDLKARIADPDPGARAPMVGEVATAERRLVAWQSRPLPDGATLISFLDVTDTRALEGALADREAALEAAERLKRRFVGNVSYELRTPLTTIAGYAELLERGGEALSERARGYVAAVHAAARQLTRSIETVLAVAELDAGEVMLDIADVDLAVLVNAAVSRWATEARAGRVTLTASAVAAGLIRGDERRLARVLDHLVENALRQTAPGGHIGLTASRTPGEARLLVADDGRGIPFHVQAHIFDRFSGEERGGPGLGLALVKALVELHGGWVALESEPGAGATFTCHLPEAGQAPEGRPELF